MNCCKEMTNTTVRNVSAKELRKKKMAISRLPGILIIHLKRFCVKTYSPHHEEVVIRKICDTIEFPEILDFGEKSPYIHEDDLNRIENGDRKYELYALLVHVGDKVDQGHYYAIVKSPSGDWFKMNDSQVLKEQAYILFYRRTTNTELEYRLAHLSEQDNKQSIQNHANVRNDKTLEEKDDSTRINDNKHNNAKTHQAHQTQHNTTRQTSDGSEYEQFQNHTNDNDVLMEQIDTGEDDNYDDDLYPMTSLPFFKPVQFRKMIKETRHSLWIVLDCCYKTRASVIRKSCFKEKNEK
ncbi:hypothetical protein RFI_06840 [Reticulomyxa filosa]|uniref:ubiquitinyl hydrolase 1 n=1 Tax=Reticulomyxa filosa TaxID=46433 RepID=X6NVE6_RETFI|nr:hypothetical protein RFI_06840 [Reticulomyxa filosa]|eukprot:ETO30280.1 hypothetical protein RFI_06840 [Reticulomyxa filosa]